MATIEELERKIQRLERQLLQETEKTNLMIRKSGKALEVALHAYRIDHAGYVWVWNKETNQYNKTDVCVKVIIPKVGPKEITNSKIADKAVNNRTLDDKSVDARVLDDNSVLARHIHDKAVTPTKVSDNFVDQVVMPSVNVLRQRHEADIKSLMAKDRDLQNQIASQQIHGLAVSNVFGMEEADKLIGISKYTLTEAFNKIWQMFEDITGEAYRGISMVVTPSYYIGEGGCTVHIEASTMNTLGIFEEIEFYWNDDAEPFVFSKEPVSHFEFDTEISESTYIKCRAKIMGLWYEAQKLITNYSSFFLGSGDTYTDMLDSQGHFKPEYAIPVKRAAHDVEVGDDKHIIIAIGENLRDWFIRADLNGMEIAFNESAPIDIDGYNYIILTSVDTYQEGVMNIDING